MKQGKIINFPELKVVENDFEVNFEVELGTGCNLGTVLVSVNCNL